MKKFLKLLVASMLIVDSTYAQFSKEASVYQNKTACVSVGFWGNSGLGPGTPFFIGVEKWVPFSENISMGIAQDLAFMLRKKDHYTYYLSTTKLNMHFQPFSTFDLYGGVAFNYLLLDKGEGANAIDDFIGFQVGLRYFADGVGFFVESGKGNYIHGGISVAF